jgi:ABC-2 type transport system permease protein
MSAHAIDVNPASAGRERRPGLGRLTRVELRKMVDTRSGFWLQLSVLALTVLAVVITVLAGSDHDQRLIQMVSNALQPAGILLPVVGILLVTSEWSQRTALVSFALVPQRGRLILAKVLAGVVLALVATVIGLLIGVLGTALASTGAPHAWSLPLGILLQDFVYVVTAMIIGVGFGLALQSSAPGIVLYFALPVAFAALGSIHALNGVVDWVNTAEALEPLTTEVMSGHQWAQGLVALALWIGIPMSIGMWRLTRRDVG